MFLGIEDTLVEVGTGIFMELRATLSRMAFGSNGQIPKDTLQRVCDVESEMKLTYQLAQRTKQSEKMRKQLCQ